MTRRFVDAYGLAHPTTPGCHAFPLPEQIAEVPFEQFESVARFGYRNLAIHNLACRISAGELDIELLRDPSIDTQELWKRLLALRGIGPYAASCLMIYLGRYSRVNVDSWARMMVSKELKRQVVDKDVHDFFAPYGEWGGLVYHFYPWCEDEPEY
jgi:3-methyladenine DNA glycosylase/8-oxoguanine DNA glycosylase